MWPSIIVIEALIGLAIEWFDIHVGGVKNLAYCPLTVSRYDLLMIAGGPFCDGILYYSLWFQVVYVTAIMPYVILLILFIRGLLLEGSTKGLIYFIEPRMDRLSDPTVRLSDSTLLAVLYIRVCVPLTKTNSSNNNNNTKSNNTTTTATTPKLTAAIMKSSAKTLHHKHHHQHQHKNRHQ